MAFLLVSLGFLELSQASLRVLCSFGHVFIKPLHFLSLLLSLHGDVLGYEVNVLHDGFYLGNVLFPLLNDFIHVVHFSMNLNSNEKLKLSKTYWSCLRIYCYRVWLSSKEVLLSN